MKKFDLDDILISIGGWGKFQTLYYAVLCTAIIFSVFPAMNYIFIARDIKYRCKIDSCDRENGDFNPDWLKNAVPFEQNVPSKCSYYQPEENDTCTSFVKNETLTCHDDFVYERLETTIVHDFNIKCDENLWKLTIIGTINVVGKLVCLPLAGFFSDRFGRKSMVIVSVLLSTIVGLVRSFSVNYYMYVGLEFLNTVVGSGIYSGAFILALELVDSKRRNLGNSIICLAFTVGHILLGAAAWVSPTWQFMTQIMYGPGILVTILLWFVPESVRWLIARNKIEKAEGVLKSIAKINGKELTEETIKTIPYLEDSKSDGDEAIPLMAILKKKSLLIRIIHCSFTWICCNFPYYGLTIQSVALSQDIYVNYMCVSVVEIPAYILAYGALDRIGRKKTLALSLILTGVACLSVDFIRAGSPLALVVFLSGKLFVTVSYMTIYIYTAELFPTSSRHSAFAVCSMFGCVGSMLAPQVPLLAKVYKPLPLMVFSALAFTAGLLAFLFPETKDTKNPDEIDKS
ncbi:solute carrier family 22 member 21 [Tribolium castaneum]|uniref:solute carrier family 22 member 21 n=1 Tax=Tribolium castaneum TaxID=7070 RepID=UPI0030FE1391